MSVWCELMNSSIQRCSAEFQVQPVDTLVCLCKLGFRHLTGGVVLGCTGVAFADLLLDRQYPKCGGTFITCDAQLHMGASMVPEQFTSACS